MGRGIFLVFILALFAPRPSFAVECKVAFKAYSGPPIDPARLARDSGLVWLGPGARTTGSDAAAASDIPVAVPGAHAAAQLGSGGYGVVYRLYDGAGNPLPVVLKVPNLRNVRDPDAKKRILESYVRERRTLARLRAARPETLGRWERYRESIVGSAGRMSAREVQDLQIAGAPFKLERVVDTASAESSLLVDYVGKDLNHIFNNSKSDLAKLLGPDPTQAQENLLTVAESVAGALGLCHSQNVLHLDVKPANILLDERVLTQPGTRLTPGRVKLADFGNAQGKQDGMPREFTPNYSHPYVSGRGRPVTGEAKPSEAFDVESVRRSLKELFDSENLREAMGKDFGNSILHLLHRHQVNDMAELLELVGFLREQVKLEPSAEAFWKSFGEKVLDPQLQGRTPRRAVLEILSLPELRTRMVDAGNLLGLSVNARARLHAEAVSLRNELATVAPPTLENVSKKMQDITNDATGGTMLYRPEIKTDAELASWMGQLATLIRNTEAR